MPEDRQLAGVPLAPMTLDELGQQAKRFAANRVSNIVGAPGDLQWMLMSPEARALPPGPTRLPKSADLQPHMEQFLFPTAEDVAARINRTEQERQHNNVLNRIARALVR